MLLDHRQCIRSKRRCIDAFPIFLERINYDSSTIGHLNKPGSLGASDHDHQHGQEDSAWPSRDGRNHLSSHLSWTGLMPSWTV